MKKIFVASDSFKGALSSLLAGEAIKRGLIRRFSDAGEAGGSYEVRVFPVGDGGEGSAEAVISALGYEKKSFPVHDPHGGITNAEYGILGRSAVFDAAECCGLALAKRYSLPLAHASSVGVGEMIAHLTSLGCTDITVCLGGSGTSDGGIGALSALGARFFIDGEELTPPLSLDSLIKISENAEKCACVTDGISFMRENVKLRLLYDSGVPLLGENGAVMLYAAQKGADRASLPMLENAMEKYSRIAERAFGVSCVSAHGSGAAGGLGFALSLLGGELAPGADRILDLVGFSNGGVLSESVSLVITGEGRTDAQTVTGKLPSKVLAAVASRGERIPVICLCGMNDAVRELYDAGMTAVFAIGDRPMTLDESLARTAELLEKCAYSIGGIIF